MEGRAVLGVRRAVNMLVSQVRRGCTVVAADTSREPWEDEDEEDDQSFRPPRAGRVAVWENALKSSCR
eukprot:2860903-Lingulodinium_polyedra.AAC.1